MFMDFAGRVLRLLNRVGSFGLSDSAYFNVSAVLLAPFAFIVTALLRRIIPTKRLMVWAIGTPLILYAFHNWDIIAVAGLVWGIVAFERNRDGWAGIALSLGASAKLFPFFVLPGMVLARLAKGDKQGAVRMGISFAGAYALVNIPWIIISSGPPAWLHDRALTLNPGGISLRDPKTNGWLDIWLFHAKRYPDFGTIWYWLAHHLSTMFPDPGWAPGQAPYRDFVSLASLVLFGLGAAWMLWKGWKRRGEVGGYPAAAVGLGIICIFLLTSKVHSPQYALWVTPLLAILAIPWSAVLFYFATDLAVLISGFYFDSVINQPSSAWQGVFEFSVWARAIALVVLVGCSLKAMRVAHPEARAPQETTALPAHAG